MRPMIQLKALLYAAIFVAASPPAKAVEPAELEELREGSMRKLVVHDAPSAAPAITYTDPEGGTHALADTDGKIRIVNFWATWCGPCREEKPALDALQRDVSGPDFEVIALATGRNSLAGIKRFNEEHGIAHLETFLDPGSAAARQMGVLGLPVSVILDRNGREIARLQGGADWSSESARAIIARLVEGEPTN